MGLVVTYKYTYDLHMQYMCIIVYIHILCTVHAISLHNIIILSTIFIAVLIQDIAILHVLYYVLQYIEVAWY